MTSLNKVKTQADKNHTLSRMSGLHLQYHQYHF